MIVLSAKQSQKIPANLAVNKISKYLYKHLDGAFKFQVSANMCDIYFLLLYQVPGIPDVKEMHINLNVTTYQNKVRVNVIEVTPEERTLGFDCYEPELIQTDLEAAKKKIFDKVVKRVSKAYEKYDFIF